LIADKSNEHQSLTVANEDNQPVAIAFDVEHHTLIGNERGVSVSCLDIRGRFPLRSAGQGIPGLKRDLRVRVLFSESLIVELQRKVSHYLQPILSHRFLNNLA